METELNREALARLRCLVSGEATIADVEEVKRWRHLSPAHERAFAAANRLWDRLGPAGRSVLEREAARPTPRRRSGSARTLTRRAVLGGAVAATAAYLVVRPPADIWPSLSELAADYRTAKGEQQRIILGDGSLMQLNTQTSVSLQAPAGNHDRIELVSGEAAITTGHKLERPLIVIAGEGRISAQGASFNVRFDGRTACITCIEGGVDLQYGANQLTLSPGQQVTYGERGLGRAAAIDPRMVMAWRDGLLVFHSTPLAEVIVEINRYRPGRIVLMNGQLGRQTVNARFRIHNVDEILTLAQRAFGARITPFPGGIVLLS
ncbi:FecR family protein [Hyphomicrobium album]|nr:FecR domain-containing protein [Hyphomicrobium album]